MAAMVASTTGWIAAPAMRALSVRLWRSDWSTDVARPAYTASALPWKLSWLLMRRSFCAWLCCASAAIMACSWPTSSGMASACCCSSLNDSSRWWTCENTRSVVAILLSSSWPACSRSRRHSADMRPSMADAATPATEVPKASPRPFTGAESEERTACRSVALSSARPVPLSVTTMPRKVPSMPSSTRKPAR